MKKKSIHLRALIAASVRANLVDITKRHSVKRAPFVAFVEKPVQRLFPVLPQKGRTR